VIEQDQRGLGRFRNRANFFDLAFANQRGRVRPGPSLQHFGDNLGARAGDQLAKFCEGSTVLGRWGVTFLAGRVAPASGEIGGFARQCRRTRQRRRPRDELDSDQQRPVRLNASDFQQTLTYAAGC
jgi:hypothetical protein